jgi:hypothetical protein
MYQSVSVEWVQVEWVQLYGLAYMFYYTWMVSVAENRRADNARLSALSELKTNKRCLKMSKI